jgi:hypothetical protein
VLEQAALLRPDCPTAARVLDVGTGTSPLLFTLVRGFAGGGGGVTLCWMVRTTVMTAVALCCWVALGHAVVCARSVQVEREHFTSVQVSH